MKKIVMFLMLSVFNIVIAGAVSAATGFNPLAVLGGGTALSYGIGSLNGTANMALQKEIWITSLVENLFADNSFMSKAINADAFVKAGLVVHIPNAGSPSNTEKNRNSFPATVKTRNDIDLTFNLDEFTTDPIKLPNADKYELNYDKRASVLMNDKQALYERVANDFIYNWSTVVAANITRTTGGSVAAHLPDATGNRKLFTKDDVKKAMTKLNKANVPQAGRWMLVDADMHEQLLDSLTAAQLENFNRTANTATGVIGQLYSFNFMMRSKAGRYTAALAKKDWTATGTTTDQAAAIYWQESYVCRALGDQEMFDSENNPLYYGDIYSFLVRAGGRPMANADLGVGAIIQDNA